MLYMFLALPAVSPGRGGSGMSAMGRAAMSATASRFSLLALVLALFMFGYVVWVGDRLTARTPAPAVGLSAPASGATSHAGCAGAGSGLGRACLGPRCAALCKIAMGITMGYMLILTL
jgi:hypothetical protein